MLNRLINFWKYSKALALITRLIDSRFKKRLNNTGFTILTPNCMGGLIYHRLGERFNSPTIDLNMQTSDFCAFLENLDYYLAQDVLECVDPKPSVNAPVGIIKGNGSDIRDIRINFIHYDSFDKAREKWNIRKKRIVPENTYVIMCDIDNIYEESPDKAGFAREEDLKKLEAFKCNNKVLLTRNKSCPKDYSLYIKPDYGRPFPLVYMNRDILGLNGFERHFDFVSFINKK